MKKVFAVTNQEKTNEIGPSAVRKEKFIEAPAPALYEI
jgi:hypothetical protein